MSDLNSDIISSFAMKRDLSSPASIKINVKKNHCSVDNKTKNIIISTGLSQGYVNDFKEARRFAEKIAKALSSVGPINIQCRKLKNKYYIFEINPRFSGTTYIRSVMGHNDIELIYNSIVLNKNYGQQTYRYSSVVRGKSLEYRISK